MTYVSTRNESEQAIKVLASRYPKCFFEEPRLRKPLKKNIVFDLQKDGAPMAYELLSSAVQWYQSHFGYLYAMQAGAKRIDLNGKEVGTVTEQESQAAQIRIKESKQKLSKNTAVRTINSLHAHGHIPTDTIRKLDAPRTPPKEATTVVKTPATPRPSLA
jgi:sRNA-binding protein